MHERVLEFVNNSGKTFKGAIARRCFKETAWDFRSVVIVTYSISWSSRAVKLFGEKNQ